MAMNQPPDAQDDQQDSEADLAPDEQYASDDEMQLLF